MMCKFEEGCILRVVLKNPEKCEKRSYQLECEMYMRFTAFPSKYRLAVAGQKFLKEI